MNKTQEFIKKNHPRFVDELIELLKIPSISADPAYTNDVLETADWVKNSLVNIGIDNVQVCETEGYPIVYGEKIVDANLPTVMIYGHYDVQPPDPIELWESGPFEPVIKKTNIHPEGAIFARGSADDKGQFYMHLKAVEAMIAADELPCNVKFMIEGEEEVGSESLEQFLEDNKEMLSNDVILISDTDIISMDQPSITVGLRGLSYMELDVTGPNRDLHSGLYGGAVANPINVLSNMLASLVDEKGKITIPGFYDGIIELTDSEKEELTKIPFDLEAYKKALDLGDVAGEEGYTTIERKSIRPTLDVNGIWGGYAGEGAKTVIASKAGAKVSMRLVPGQNPERISKLFDEHIQNIAPKSVKVKVTYHHGGQPYLTPTNFKAYEAAIKAYSYTFEKPAIANRGGGSIPIVSLFESVLGSKSILMGFGLASDAIHSPNEHYGLKNFEKGIETIPYFFKHYMEE